MAPSFLNFKDLRRRSRASFRTDRSTDTASDASPGTTPTSGSLTPPSISEQSDIALDQQVKEKLRISTSSTGLVRPPPPGTTNGSGSKRNSVSGMAGLGSPVQSGRIPGLPVSQYSPQITNVPDNSWVSAWEEPKDGLLTDGLLTQDAARHIKKSCWFTELLATRLNRASTAQSPSAGSTTTFPLHNGPCANPTSRRWCT